MHQSEEDRTDSKSAATVSKPAAQHQAPSRCSKLRNQRREWSGDVCGGAYGFAGSIHWISGCAGTVGGKGDPFSGGWGIVVHEHHRSAEVLPRHLAGYEEGCRRTSAIFSSQPCNSTRNAHSSDSGARIAAENASSAKNCMSGVFVSISIMRMLIGLKQGERSLNGIHDGGQHAKRGQADADIPPHLAWEQLPDLARCSRVRSMMIGVAMTITATFSAVSARMRSMFCCNVNGWTLPCPLPVQSAPSAENWMTRHSQK